MACRAVSVGNADGVGDAELPERTGEGDRPDLVHSTHHEFWRQFRFTGDFSLDPRAGAARTGAWGLVAGGAATTVERAHGRRHGGNDQDRAYRAPAAGRDL